jgi:hypothetical protein
MDWGSAAIGFITGMLCAWGIKILAVRYAERYLNGMAPSHGFGDMWSRFDGTPRD